MATFSLAFGSATKNSQGKIIEAFFPNPLLNPAESLITDISALLNYQGGNEVFEISSEQATLLAAIFTQHDDAANAKFSSSAARSAQPLVLVILAQDSKPETVAEGFLKLQLISHRLIKPHGTVLDGIFGLLHNIAWTNQGPIDLPELADRQIEARLAGEVLTVSCVDKFPKMTDYVVPEGVRIAHTARVRLGAHIGKGTTIMHEGFVNFNAGTTGVSMVEGRISAGVIIGEGTDIGGGASIMGTLSGGGQLVISMGENCLLGANAGLGIPLGDRCTLESGLYITAGSKVQMLDAQNKPFEVVKARDLAGQNDLLFRRNSITGTIECLTNKTAVELNSELHSNN